MRKMMNGCLLLIRKHGIRDDAARIHLFSKMLEFWGGNL